MRSTTAQRVAGRGSMAAPRLCPSVGSDAAKGVNTHGLVACDLGTLVILWRCNDDAACLAQVAARTRLMDTAVGSQGEFAFTVPAADVGSAALLFEAAVTDATVYRVMDFGNVGGGRARTASGALGVAAMLLEEIDLSSEPVSGCSSERSAELRTAGCPRRHRGRARRQSGDRVRRPRRRSGSGTGVQRRAGGSVVQQVVAATLHADADRDQTADSDRHRHRDRLDHQHHARDADRHADESATAIATATASRTPSPTLARRPPPRRRRRRTERRPSRLPRPPLQP
jgi:hypothetical protein